MSVRQLVGDCREVLATLEAQSVQTVVTSPPFLGLRSYLPAGHPDKAHEIGLESTPTAFVRNLVDVFAEVWRVLRDDGVLWIELGDSYVSNASTSHIPRSEQGNGTGLFHIGPEIQTQARRQAPNRATALQREGIPMKSLLGMPWRVAFALQDWGWILRQEVIWHHTNAMPESVQDRCTRAHSTVFMFAKKPHYYYDGDAVREESKPWHTAGSGSAFVQDRIPTSHKRQSLVGAHGSVGMDGNGKRYEAGYNNPLGRNKRSVWSIASAPYSGAHFACFPPALVEPMVLSSTSAYGACVACGTPWERQTEREPMVIHHGPKAGGYGSRTTDGLSGTMLAPARTETVGWGKACRCATDEVKPCVVLDPFAGSGTTGRVATKHGRDCILIDLNPAYQALQDDRVAGVQMSMESVL